MKKFLCLFLAVMLCLSFGATAFAAELEAEIPEEDVSLADAELDVSDEETECFDVLESDEPTAEEMDSGEGTVSPMVYSPTTASEFHIVSCKVYPAYIENGKNAYYENCVTYEPRSFAPTTIRDTMTKAEQQELIASAERRGHEVIGWYITGTFYMDCYLPHWVEYYIYSHDQNGEEKKAHGIRRIATISNYFLFPEDTSKNYTYGYDGRGYMTCYNKAINNTYELYPEFDMKVTFSAT